MSLYVNKVKSYKTKQRGSISQSNSAVTDTADKVVTHYIGEQLNLVTPCGNGQVATALK